MATLRLRRAVRPAAALALLAAAVPAQPSSAQAIVGRVRAGTALDPVPHAVVRLLDLDLAPVGRVTADEDGRYRVEPPAPGRYHLLVEVAGFATHLSDPLPVEATGLVDHAVDLAPVGGPSEPVAVLDAEAIARACGRPQGSSPRGIVVGQVREPGGETLRGAWVTAQWPTGSGAGRQEGRSGVDGLFVLCEVPAGLPVAVRAAATDRVGPPVSIQLLDQAVHRVDLALPRTPSDRPGRILGRVTDVSTGVGIASALLTLDGAGLHLWTDANGHFALDSVPAGLHTLRIGHVAYATREVGLVVTPDGSHGLQVPLAHEPIELAPVVVTARSPRWYGDMRGFQRRMLLSAGAFLTREDIARLQPTRLVDLLREVPGVRVDARGREPEIHMRGRRCDPDVVVDRVRRRDRALLTELRGEDLEAVEIYRSAAENPGDVVPPGACGAILVWTRRAVV